MNRFFYKCGRCLLKLAVDSERQPYFDSCPICGAEYGVIHFLGATRGVLSMQAPCDERCTYATGPDCSCACAGKNHGSRIVVPVVEKVLSLDPARFPDYSVIQGNYKRYREECAAFRAAAPAAGLGEWRLKGTMSRIHSGGSYAIRFSRLEKAREEFGVSLPAPLVVIPSPAVAAAGPSAAPSRQLLLF